MKTSNKSSLITGIILITLSALFTISLLILPFGYGFGNEGSSNIFFVLGNMIFCAFLVVMVQFPFQAGGILLYLDI